MGNIASRQCANVQAYFQHEAKQARLNTPPHWLVEHAAHCASCRGALTLFAASLLASPPTPLPTNCARCEEELAAFIDYELETTAIDALAAFPEVGWHLWICPSCASLYRLVQALEAATQTGDLTMPHVNASSHILYSLRLSRSFLDFALPRPQPALGALRGRTSGDTVLASEQAGRYQMILSVERQPDTSWDLIVKVIPPCHGWLSLTLGDHKFRERFGSDGQATIHSLPSALLEATDGPELVATVESDQTPDRG